VSVVDSFIDLRGLLGKAEVGNLDQVKSNRYHLSE
jgi:hypothetical protein